MAMVMVLVVEEVEVEVRTRSRSVRRRTDRGGWREGAREGGKEAATGGSVVRVAQSGTRTRDRDTERERVVESENTLRLLLPSTAFAHTSHSSRSVHTLFTRLLARSWLAPQASSQRWR